MEAITIKKSRLKPAHRRFNRLVDKSVNILKPAIAEWFDFALKQIRRDLAQKFAKDEAADITTELTHWEVIEGNGVRTIKPAVLKIMGNGAQEAYKIAEIPGAFDILNVEAVKIVEEICAKLVKDVTDETRNGIKLFIRDGIKQGKSMPKIARELRPIVGLNEKQAKAALNYRDWLGENRPELSAAEVDKRVGVYERKLHRHRTEMIARTETARAQSEGYVLGLEQEGIEKVEFSAYPGCCDDCKEKNKEEYTIKEAHGVIPVHPNCRCALLPVVE